MKIDTPYRAGYMCGRYRPTTKNCHFCWFSSLERSIEWERGKKDGAKRKSESKPKQK